MRIKHLTLSAGPEGTFPAGTERDVADAEGRALVAGGYAIKISPRRPEFAAKPPPEKSTTAEQDAAQHLAKHRTALAADLTLSPEIMQTPASAAAE